MARALPQAPAPAGVWKDWGDVPLEHKAALFVKAGPCQQGPPSVKYRGLFLKDENPDLTQWVRDKSVSKLAWNRIMDMKTKFAAASPAL